jgi:chromosome segregation ATPase
MATEDPVDARMENLERELSRARAEAEQLRSTVTSLRRRLFDRQGGRLARKDQEEFQVEDLLELCPELQARLEGLEAERDAIRASLEGERARANAAQDRHEALERALDSALRERDASVTAARKVLREFGLGDTVAEGVSVNVGGAPGSGVYHHHGEAIAEVVEGNLEGLRPSQSPPRPEAGEPHDRGEHGRRR